MGVQLYPLWVHRGFTRSRAEGFLARHVARYWRCFTVMQTSHFTCGSLSG